MSQWGSRPIDAVDDRALSRAAWLLYLKALSEMCKQRALSGPNPRSSNCFKERNKAHYCSEKMFDVVIVILFLVPTSLRIVDSTILPRSPELTASNDRPKPIDFSVHAGSQLQPRIQ